MPAKCVNARGQKSSLSPSTLSFSVSTFTYCHPTLESASLLKAIQIPYRSRRVPAQATKCLQNCERGTGTLNAFAELTDFLGLDMSEQRASLRKVLDFLGKQAHDAGARCVHRNWIVAAYEHAARFRLALDWSISFHANDAIHNRKIRSHRSVDIENRAIDSCPVKHILRPTVASAGNNAKHIFQRQCYAGPVMRFELGE